MSHVELLLSEYKEAHRSGADADPGPFLSRLEGADREALAGLIDAYLARVPRRDFDPGAFRGSPAAEVAEGVQRSLAGSAGLWPALLPRLRAQARLRRSDLVAELAARLGAQSRQEKVASYYHEMEQGLLPASGVSDTVLEALGKILGWSGEALRGAGGLPAPPAGASEAAPGAVFARTTPLPADAAAAPPPSPTGRAESAGADWDEVDRLFRGGA
jgi:hypothetical protein